jgi:hypothetical protein
MLFLQHGQVGMVLDLSNSDKYYDSQVIIGNSVRYVKVSVRVHGPAAAPPALR